MALTVQSGADPQRRKRNQLKKERGNSSMEWLSANWEWVLLGFMVLEKVVKMSPSDKDDILLDVVVQGLTRMVKGESK